MILLLAAPAAAEARVPVEARAAAEAQSAQGAPVGARQVAQGAAFAVPRPAVPLRDVVRQAPGTAGARIAATASSERYPINDGSGATIAVSISADCAQECDAADPQAIANTVGTFIHGPEVELLTVQLVTPFELGFDCGFEAQSCYFGGENTIILSGNDDPAPDTASREFVLAHEYGHHVAQHRDMPAPFLAAINWGPERWSSVEHVCQGHRAGALFPGDEGSHYYEDPGEAFAESFAFNRYPEAAVKWAWAPALRPTPASLAALRRDTLRPWTARRSFTVEGHVSRSGAVVQEFRTPFDGMVSIGPVGEPGLGYRLAIRNHSGHLLRSSRQGVSFRHRLDYTVCGQSRLRVAVQATGKPGKRFRLTIQRP
ncbi:MAG TPA: hypothetical protein VGO13_00665 [Solirubrobacterales bacterium]|jgi:hypothetical protein|nr:hypothetical protein [Solirubrobacterales bacterium]